MTLAVTLNLAVIFSEHLNDAPSAFVELQATLAMRPSFIPALLNLGNLHEDLGEFEDAKAVYRKVLAIASDNGLQKVDLPQLAFRRQAEMRLGRARGCS